MIDMVRLDSSVDPIYSPNGSRGIAVRGGFSTPITIIREPQRLQRISLVISTMVIVDFVL